MEITVRISMDKKTSALFEDFKKRLDIGSDHAIERLLHHALDGQQRMTGCYFPISMLVEEIEEKSSLTIP